MSKKTGTKSVKKRPVLMTGRFYSTPVKIDKKGITIKLPLKVAEYFELDKKEVFWTPVNGVIQLSATQPNVVIPALCVGVDKFVPLEVTTNE